MTPDYTECPVCHKQYADHVQAVECRDRHVLRQKIEHRHINTLKELIVIYETKAPLVVRMPESQIDPYFWTVMHQDTAVFLMEYIPELTQLPEQQLIRYSWEQRRKMPKRKIKLKGLKRVYAGVLNFIRRIKRWVKQFK